MVACVQTGEGVSAGAEGRCAELPFGARGAHLEAQVRFLPRGQQLAVVGQGCAGHLVVVALHEDLAVRLQVPKNNRPPQRVQRVPAAGQVLEAVRYITCARLAVAGRRGNGSEGADGGRSQGFKLNAAPTPGTAGPWRGSF